ncbi:hypothetical protein BJX65DRAFT_295786 [Aspergillus insuetus]
MERWATADQSFRDSYHDRATSNPSPTPAILSEDSLEVKRFVSLVPVDKDSQPKEYTHLLKNFRTAGGGPTPQIPTFIPADDYKSTPVSIEDTVSTLFLRTAEFRGVGMTRSGTAIFLTEYNEIWYILDEKSLETGLINVVRFQSNGSIEYATHRRPFNLTQIMIFHIGNGWPLKELINEGIGGRPHRNQPYVLET